MNRFETDSLKDRYTTFLSKDIRDAVDTLEAEDSKRAYTVNDFLNDAASLRATEQPSSMALRRSLEYALTIIDMKSDADVPTSNHPQVLMRILLDRSITSYEGTNKIASKSLHHDVDSLLGAALDLTILRRGENKGFDGDVFNSTVSTRLRLPQISRGKSYPAPKK